MSELIKLSANTIGGEQIQTVNGRDLHTFLGIKKDYSNWAKAQIDRAGFIENVDYVKTQDLSSPKKASTKSRAQVCINYHFTLSASKEISMMSNTPKGKEARLYFIECEKVAKAKTAAQMIPQTLSEALRLAADLEDKRLALAAANQQLTQQIEQDKTKVDAANRFLKSQGDFTIRLVAKAIGVGVQWFYDYLRQKKIISMKNEPYADFCKRGIIRPIPGYYEGKNGEDKCRMTTHITSSGVYYFFERLKKEGHIPAMNQIDFSIIQENAT